jgi:hypothetical protein
VDPTDIVCAGGDRKISNLAVITRVINRFRQDQAIDGSDNPLPSGKTPDSAPPVWQAR